MTKKEFLNTLNQHNLNPSIICWEDSVKDDVFCVYSGNGVCNVYYQERGKRFREMAFQTESDALEYLLTQLL